LPPTPQDPGISCGPKRRERHVHVISHGPHNPRQSSIACAGPDDAATRPLDLTLEPLLARPDTAIGAGVAHPSRSPGGGANSAAQPETDSCLQGPVPVLQVADDITRFGYVAEPHVVSAIGPEGDGAQVDGEIRPDDSGHVGALEIVLAILTAAVTPGDEPESGTAEYARLDGAEGYSQLDDCRNLQVAEAELVHHVPQLQVHTLLRVLSAHLESEDASAVVQEGTADESGTIALGESLLHVQGGAGDGDAAPEAQLETLLGFGAGRRHCDKCEACEDRQDR